MKQKRVAVVGAGLTGLCCAEQLTNTGFEVTIYDKSNHVGGRTARKVIDNESVDNGAQYFTARNPKFVQRVSEWCSLGIVAEWSAKIGMFENGEWLSSPDKQTRWVGLPTMDSIANHLLQTVETKCGVTLNNKHLVTKVTSDAGGWFLDFKEHETSSKFDCVIIAVPAEQALAIIPDIESQRLETKYNCVHAPCWSVQLAFDKPLTLAFDGVFCHHPIFRWISYDSSKPGRSHSLHHYIIHMSQEWSIKNLERTRQEIITMIIEALNDCLNIDAKPIYSGAHRWRYAIPHEHYKSDGEGLLLDANLVVTGDWARGGRLENAFLSGIEAADLVIGQLLNKPTRTESNDFLTPC